MYLFNLFHFSTVYKGGQKTVKLKKIITMDNLKNSNSNVESRREKHPEENTFLDTDNSSSDKMESSVATSVSEDQDIDQTILSNQEINNRDACADESMNAESSDITNETLATEYTEEMLEQEINSSNLLLDSPHDEVTNPDSKNDTLDAAYNEATLEPEINSNNISYKLESPDDEATNSDSKIKNENVAEEEHTSLDISLITN
jgi:hypothetical protein